MTRSGPRYIVIACASLTAGACSAAKEASFGGTSAADTSDASNASDAAYEDARSTGQPPETEVGSDAPIPETLAELPTPPADAIHVALTGHDDTGDGSATAPYRHVQYALENATSNGATLILHAGTYEEQVRIRNDHVTLQAAPGERAHITCPISIDADDPPLCIEIDAESTGVTLRGLEVSGGFYAVFLGSHWDYDDTPLDNPAANHVLIEDCIIHDTGRDAVKIPAGCDDVTIRGCEIYNSGRGYPPNTSLDDKNAEGIDAVNADRVHIADTYIHDTATTCVYVKGGSIDTVIERTRAERCGGLGIALGFDTSPEFFDTTVNPGYYENIGGVVRNSIVIDTGLAGLALYATRDAKLLHNTVVRAGTEGHAGIYLGVATQDYDPGAGRPANTNPTIIGNIVDQSGLADLGGMAEPVCFGIRYTEEDQLGVLSALTGPFTIRDNLYFGGTGTSCRFRDGRPSTRLEDGDLTAWQAHGAGFDVSSRVADPRLDATGHLQSGSPAIDAMSATDGVGDDVDGQARTAPYDVGADERL